MKKLVVKSLEKVMSLIARWKLEIDTNITLGNNTYIHPSAKLDTRFGGTILIGDNTNIWEGVLILTYGGDIIIGNNCDINPYTVIYGHGGTKIGDDVLIAGHCMVIPANHKYKNIGQPIRSQGLSKKGIVIKNNVWIAHSCSILDGVTLEKGVIVAAGSVVTHSVPENNIVAGVPANIKRELNVHKG